MELKPKYTAPIVGLARPPTKTRGGSTQLGEELDQLTKSLNRFSARALTVCDAGFALKTHGSLVNGLMPLRAGVAGFFFSFKFNAPTNLKDPFFFNCPAATDM